MINGIFEQPGYAAASKMLDATALRQEAIARNMANIETPNYKRVDVDASFQSALKDALASGDSRRIESIPVSLIQDPAAVSSTLDGNTVQLESELMQLSQNTMAHQLETQMLSSTFAKLRLAISGRE
jgi:flagellar basal-body rod protein FlgB